MATNPNHLYSQPRLVDFILSEANGQRSRENAVVTQAGAEVKSGTLLAKLASGKYVPYVNGDADAGVAAAILYTHLPSATGDTKAVIFTRDCEVKRSALTGLDEAGDALVDLNQAGIAVRGVDTPGISTPAL